MRLKASLIFACLFATCATPSVADESVDFAKQIIPILTKAGCNSGACHGAAAGRGYLQLSLFGSRPAADFESLYHTPGQRFIDTAQPIRSLLIQKPSGFLEHGGGVRLDSESADYQRLVAWIKAGSPPSGPIRLERIELQPQSLDLTSEVILPVGQEISVAARAWWSDGSSSDVSEWLSVEGAGPSTDSDAAVTQQWRDGRIYLTPHRVGVWPIALRVAAASRAVQIWCHAESHRTYRELPNEIPVAGKQNTDQPISDHSIDSLVKNVSQRLGMTLAPPVATHLLVRRMWIDLLGRHPTLAEWQSASEQIENGDKGNLVDQLLASPEFATRAALTIAGWVSDSSKTGVDPRPLQTAIAQRLSQNDDLLDLVRDMLMVTASEKTRAEQAVLPDDGLNAFHRFATDPRSRAELVASVWMGVRIGCAQCHDHPLDHWTQDDYFSFAACWAEIDSKNSVDRFIGRTTSDLRNGEPAIPRLPGRSVGQDSASSRTAAPLSHQQLPGSELAATLPPDIGFVNWLCAPDNDYLATNLANRLWQWCFGRGLVVDEDDHRETNPPAIRELLTLLTQRLQANEFHLRPSLREIILSDAYARSNVSAEVPIEDRELQVKLLVARTPKEIEDPAFETLVMQALPTSQSGNNSTNVSQANGQGSETMMMAAITSECARYKVCQDKFSQNLDIAAGRSLNQQIATQAAYLIERRENKLVTEDMIAQMYLNLFGHQPGVSHLTSWTRVLAETAADPQSQNEFLQDVLWSLLVSEEFRRLQ